MNGGKWGGRKTSARVTMQKEERQIKRQVCDHPEDAVLQTASDKPWEGLCEECGKRVKLVAVPMSKDKQDE